MASFLDAGLSETSSSSPDESPDEYSDTTITDMLSSFYLQCDELKTGQVRVNKLVNKLQEMIKGQNVKRERFQELRSGTK